MTREFELDEECVADLKLRAHTEYDRTRTRPESYSWSPPKIVGGWRCRNSNCKTIVDVPDDAMESFCMFNAQLRARGEEPLDHSKILFCPRCQDEFRATAPARRRGQVDRMAVAIRQLKESGDATRERDLIAQLEQWGHPDVDGLVKAIAERRAAESGRAGKTRRTL